MHARMQGLGFPAISNLQTTPAFFNMLADGQLDAPVFSLYLNPDISAEPAGELGFGLVDPSKYVGKITYTPVTEKKCAALSLIALAALLVSLAPLRWLHKKEEAPCCQSHCISAVADIYATGVCLPCFLPVIMHPTCISVSV